MSDILDYCKGREARTFKPGQVMINEGGQDGNLFVLIDGQVEVLRKDTQVSYIDEPGSLFGEMSRLLRQLGITAVYVTHDRREAELLADQIVYLSAGRVAAVRAVTPTSGEVA